MITFASTDTTFTITDNGVVSNYPLPLREVKLDGDYVTITTQDNEAHKFNYTETAYGSGQLLYDYLTAFAGFVNQVNILARQDNDENIALSATAEGHLEVAIHAPILPFGSVHAESLTPEFQVDSVYGINPREVITTTGHAVTPGTANSGAVTGTNNLFKCSTGTTQYSFASLQSRKRLRYRAGQGVVGRFTALWSTPVASSTVVAGFGTSESCIYCDTAATTCSFSSNGQVLFAYTLGQNSGGAYQFEDELKLQPGETLTLAAREVTIPQLTLLLFTNTYLQIEEFSL